MKAMVLKALLLAALTGSLLAGVASAGHSDSPSEMKLLKNKFHYLGQTLWGGAQSTVTVPEGTYTITISNEDRAWHLIEFELGETEFKSGKIYKGFPENLVVTLTPGTWEVYCERHTGQKGGMLFYLVVTPVVPSP